MKFLYIIPLCLILSCQFVIENKKVPVKKNSNSGISKTYYKSGAIKSEISVNNGKKNGIAKKYYPTGELHTTVNYINNIKEGETIWYYKTGQPYRVTTYVNGKKQGIRKIYYENGKLQAEIPYNNDELMKGTKEYDKRGNVITEIPKIKFMATDLLRFENKYILTMTLSKSYRKVQFFEERTSTEGNKIKIPINTKNKAGKLEYFIPPGDFKMTILKIYARYNTKLGNPVLISSSYNLAIENR